MSEKSTPSFAEFVRRHRAAEGIGVHEQAELTAACTFDWLGATAAGIAECSVGAIQHHRNDAREAVVVSLKRRRKHS